MTIPTQGMQWSTMPGKLQDDVEKMLARGTSMHMSHLQQVRDGGRRVTNSPRPVITSFQIVEADASCGDCPHLLRVPIYQNGTHKILLLTLSQIPHLRAWAQYPVFRQIMSTLAGAGLSKEDALGLAPQIFHCTFGAAAVLEVEVGYETYILMTIRREAKARGFSESTYCKPPGSYCRLGDDPFRTAQREFTHEANGVSALSFAIDPVCSVALFNGRPDSTFVVRATTRRAELPTIAPNHENKLKRTVWIPRSAVLRDLNGDNRDLVQAFRECGISDVFPQLRIHSDVTASMRELYHGLGLYTP